MQLSAVFKESGSTREDAIRAGKELQGPGRDLAAPVAAADLKTLVSEQADMSGETAPSN